MAGEDHEEMTWNILYSWFSPDILLLLKYCVALLYCYIIIIPTHRLPSPPPPTPFLEWFTRLPTQGAWYIQRTCSRTYLHNIYIYIYIIFTMYITSVYYALVKLLPTSRLRLHSTRLDGDAVRQQKRKINKNAKKVRPPPVENRFENRTVPICQLSRFCKLWHQCAPYII